MTRRSTDAPNLTSKEALRLYLTGGAQNAPVRHHVVSCSYLDTRSTGTERNLLLLASPVEPKLVSATRRADRGRSIPQLLSNCQT